MSYLCRKSILNHYVSSFTLILHNIKQQQQKFIIGLYHCVLIVIYKVWTKVGILVRNEKNYLWKEIRVVYLIFIRLNTTVFEATFPSEGPS